MKIVINIFHQLFIPQENNNYRAKALHPDFIFYYLIFALVLTFSLKKLPQINILGFATDITVEKLVALTNQERQKFGLNALQYNDKLAQAAYLKAQDMFTKNYWAHYAPDGKTPWDFILAAGYQYEYAGENLAKNFLFSQGVFDAWMNSVTHRENILRKDYTEVGFAVVNGVLNGQETTLVVQMFGKPQLALPLAQTIPQRPVQAEEIPPVREKPIVTTSPTSSTIMQSSTVNNQSLPINSPRLTYDINIIFLIFITIALIFDLYFAAKYRIFPIGGKNLAHLIFILFIIFGLSLVTQGKIL